MRAARHGVKPWSPTVISVIVDDTHIGRWRSPTDKGYSNGDSPTFNGVSAALARRAVYHTEQWTRNRYAGPALRAIPW